MTDFLYEPPAPGPDWRREDDPVYALADALEASWGYGETGPFKFHLAGAEELLAALTAKGWSLTRP